MTVAAADYWTDLPRRTLAVYAEPLLRQVAAKLIRPRNQWPVDELIARCTDTLNNPVAVDRRIQELEPAARQVLALIGHSRQQVWNLGNLVELAIALGHTDGLKPVFDLLTAGLLYPYFNPPPGEDEPPRVQTFEQWLGFAGPTGLTVFMPPLAGRAVGEALPLPDLSAECGCGRRNEQLRGRPFVFYSAFRTPHSAFSGSRRPGNSATGRGVVATGVSGAVAADAERRLLQT